MFTFDPDRVAALETVGWRAYYDRRWGLLLRQVVTMCQEQFHIPFPQSLVAAYHATRAAMAWAPVDHDLHAVETSYARFYRMARRYSGLSFDPEQVASLELEYNVVHRDLVGQSDKSRFVDTMTRLHSTVFGISPEQARESAEQRVLANTIVDRITSGVSSDANADWRLIETALRRCYRSIDRQLPRGLPINTGRTYDFTRLSRTVRRLPSGHHTSGSVAEFVSPTNVSGDDHVRDI